MNAKTKMAIYQNRQKYKTPGCTSHNRRPINAIFLSAANSKEHEMAKCKICHDLLIDGNQFITEAHELETELRRDIVCLNDNQIIEVDNSKSKRGRRHPAEVLVYWYDLKRWRTLNEVEIKSEEL